MQNFNFGRWIVWGGFALTLLIAPLIFNKGASLSLLCQMGTFIILALSYNMLLGQGGMLSFGHAVYSGLGAFCAIHALNLAAAGSVAIPVTLIPLVGGVAGLFFGALFGYVTTKKSGTTFAMITLGIVELVFACSLMFPKFFGGEGGISTNRVIGEAFFGISYGPQIQVYYLIAFWLFICTIAMFAFTQTPLGRIINAVRDNPERAEFIGYDPQWVRYLVLMFSAFFAGISGGLTALNFEIVSAENVSALRSGAILLFTVIGGAGFFFGPLIGAILGVFLTVMLSDFSSAWQLYFGVFFLLIVMYAPGGIAGLIMQIPALIRSGKIRYVLPQLGLTLFAGLLMTTGFVMMVEMLYHLTLNAANGSGMQLFGFAVDTAQVYCWLFATTLLCIGLVGGINSRKRLLHAWQLANPELLDEEKQVRV
ncbi:branched-chain amino acid ABC transporter permease [Herminiimonas fonticola]|uniref:Amino acid/amide ABC transporter membrane protein 2 (HAAT family) n=1 Tax=Herminiimonas fonticola TaxID=303380 RepID=A0A4R6G1Z3_9BURK|nr:branched-chain amino acid ABC transporter permease [Herminiimonas fonticola]RBA23468.1 Branched-chain amino acid transport system / permease component [Herminiimonas fonticola]TDN88277.1 amino acid/amide ABC transporter membrane protein 2 (HAAT family) [Herminiimonas fonticola]